MRMPYALTENVTDLSCFGVEDSLCLFRVLDRIMHRSTLRALYSEPGWPIVGFAYVRCMIVWCRGKQSTVLTNAFAASHAWRLAAAG